MLTSVRFAVFTAALCTPFVCAAFSDLYGSPYAAAINFVEREGIVEGYADGTFKPDQTINRAEFVKILVGTMPQGDGVDCRQQYFKDVKLADWFSAFVCVAKQQSVIDGYSDGTFRPASDINFVEAAKILSLAFDIAAPGISQSDAWYAPYVRSLEKKNAIPVSISSFDQKITRGEMAEMIYRLLNPQSEDGNDLYPYSQTYESLSLATEDRTTFSGPYFSYTFSYPASWKDAMEKDSSAPSMVNMGPTCDAMCRESGNHMFYVRSLPEPATFLKDAGEDDAILKTYVTNGNTVAIIQQSGLCRWYSAVVSGSIGSVEIGGACLGENPLYTKLVDEIAASVRFYKNYP